MAASVLEQRRDVVAGEALYLRDILELTADLPNDAYVKDPMDPASDLQETIAVAALGIMAELRALRVEVENLSRRVA